MSSKELRAKLRRKAANPAEIEPVIEALREYGAIDDARFASSYAGSRAESGQRGKARVLADLLARRVEPQTAHNAVEEAFRDVDEARTIEQWINRKYRGQDLRELLKTQAKFNSAYRRLRTAGFGGQASLKVLKRLSEGAHGIEEIEDEATTDSL
jgi:SOS response regulatory protein OraA/RecX